MRTRGTKIRLSGRAVLIALGFLSLVPYLYAWRLQDLRQHTVEFEFAFFAAFALYAIASLCAARARVPRSHPGEHVERGLLAIIFGLAILYRAVLLFTPPTLSDDMYRYVWDGRVQAQGISPYAYPPNAPALAYLRDTAIWPHINRPDAVTVYPAGAELVYAALWRIVPDNVRWFQIVMAAGDLLAGALLVKLLQALDQPIAPVLVYLWSPLVIFETAHSAHVDGLVLPLLVAAWLARVKGRDALTGALLGAAAALKIYPALLLPALWRPRDDLGRAHALWSMPVAFAATFALPYGPYLAQGAGVAGYLQKYFDERFNTGLAGLVTRLVDSSLVPSPLAVQTANAVLALVLVAVSTALVLRPAQNGAAAVRRSIWMMGAFTLLTQNLFPWYLLWLVPLLPLFFRGRLAEAWTGWFLFTGLVAFAYTFFIEWKPVLWTAWVEFAPLYLFLVVPAARELFRLHFQSRWSVPHETSSQV